MSFTHKTPNYGLPQYGENDKPSVLVDMNDAYLAIDKGMHDNSATLESMQNQVDAVNNRMDAVETEFQNTQQLANTALQQSTEAKAIAVSAQNAANLAEHHAEISANAAQQAAQSAQQAASGVAGLRDQVNKNTSDIATLNGKVNSNTQNITNLQAKTENINQQVTVINQFVETIAQYKVKTYYRPNIPLWPGYDNYLYATSNAEWDVSFSWNPDLKTLIINTSGNRVIRAEWNGDTITNPMPSGSQNVIIPASSLLSYQNKPTVPLVRLPFMVSAADFDKQINAGTISFQIGKTITVSLPGETSYNNVVEVPFQSFTNTLIIVPGGVAGSDGNKWLWIMMMTTGIGTNSDAWMVRSPAIGDGRTVNLSAFETLIDYFDN